MKQEIILSIFLYQFFGAFGIRISQKKCQDYQRNTSSISFSQNSEEFSDNADLKEFPFMAKVYLNKNDTNYYNGLLISENFVLTVGSTSGSEINYRNQPYVLLGDYVARGDYVIHRDYVNSKPQRINIIQHIMSPQDHLTLLKLRTFAKFNHYVRPLCLSQPETFRITQSLTEVGWGIKNMLRKVKMDLIANEKCNEIRKDGVGPTRICAIKKEIDCDNWWDEYRVQDLYANGCALLNGHRQEEPHSNELVGISAKTNHYSCEKGHPEEFVRISAYIDWIENNVWPSNSAITRTDYLIFPACIVLSLQLISILN